MLFCCCPLKKNSPVVRDEFGHSVERKFLSKPTEKFDDLKKTALVPMDHVPEGTSAQRCLGGFVVQTESKATPTQILPVQNAYASTTKSTFDPAEIVRAHQKILRPGGSALWKGHH